MVIGKDELILLLENHYYNDGLREMIEVLSVNLSLDRQEYLDLFFSGLASTNTRVRHFSVCVLKHCVEIDYHFILDRHPKLDDYTHDRDYQEYIRENIEKDKTSRYGGISTFFENQKLLDKFANMIGDEKNNMVQDILKTTAELASHDLLPHGPSHILIFETIKNAPEPIVEKGLIGLNRLPIPTHDPLYIQQFGDYLMEKLRRTSLDFWFNHPQMVIADLIFYRLNLLSYLWSNEEYVRKILAVIDSINDMNRRLDVLKQVRGFAKEESDKRFLQILENNGREESEVSVKYIRNYCKEFYKSRCRLSDDSLSFLLHVCFCWSKEASDYIWTTFLQNRSVNFSLLQKYDINDMTTNSQTRLVDLFLDTNDSRANRIISEIFWDIISKMGSLHNDITYRVLYALSTDKSDFVLELMIQIAKENHKVYWSSLSRDICMKYLEEHSHDSAKEALENPAIDWSRGDVSWML